LHRKRTVVDRLLINIRARRIGYFVKKFGASAAFRHANEVAPEVAWCGDVGLIDQFLQLVGKFDAHAVTFGALARVGEWKLAERIYAENFSKSDEILCEAIKLGCAAAAVWLVGKWPGEREFLVGSAISRNNLEVLRVLGPKPRELENIFWRGFKWGLCELIEFAISYGFAPRIEEIVKELKSCRNLRPMLKIVLDYKFAVDYELLFREAVTGVNLCHWASTVDLVPRPELLKPILFDCALRESNYDWVNYICENWPGDEPREPAVAVIKHCLKVNMGGPIEKWWTKINVGQAEELHKLVIHQAIFADKLPTRNWLLRILEFMERNWPIAESVTKV
jgi:hypothetical protein